MHTDVMYTVLVVKPVVSVDSLTTVGFVLTTSVVLVTGIMLVSTVVLVSVVGTVIVDDLDVTTVDITGQVVVLNDIEISASVCLLFS